MGSLSAFGDRAACCSEALGQQLGRHVLGVIQPSAVASLVVAFSVGGAVGAAQSSGGALQPGAAIAGVER